MSMTTTQCLLLALALPAAALAQDPPPERTQEERLRELEERLKEAEAGLEALEAAHRRGLPLSQQATDDRDPAPLRLVAWEAAPRAAALPPTSPDEAAALSWLKGQQAADGRWATDTGRDVAVTARAVLAFLGRGHTHRFGDHKPTVNAALRWLKGRQAPDGWLGAPGDPLAILDHTHATMVLCEAYAVSRDFTLKPHAQRALDALLLARRPDGGFGLSRPRAASNTLCTTYAVLALKTARTAGLEVAPAQLAGIAAVFSTTTADGRTGLFAPGDAASVAVVQGSAPGVPLMTAGAAISHVFLGGRRSDPWFRALHANLTPPDPLQAEPAYWYLATLAQLQVRGEAWKAWAPAALASLHALQQADGAFRPAGLWGELGGTTGTTVECLLTLEVLGRAARTYPRAGD